MAEKEGFELVEMDFTICRGVPQSADKCCNSRLF